MRITNALVILGLGGLLSAGCAGQQTGSEPATPAVEQAAHPESGVAELYAGLYAARQERLADLEAYADAGRFPANSYRSEAVSVFVDDQGASCAVADLMQRSGSKELVEQVRSTNNLVRLEDVSGGPVVDWILESGLVKEECQLIQPVYPVLGEDPPESTSKPEVDPSRIHEISQSLIRSRLRAVHDHLVHETPRVLELATKRLIERRGWQASCWFASPAASGWAARLRLTEGGWVRFSRIGADGNLESPGRWVRHAPGAEVSLPQGAPQDRYLCERWPLGSAE